MYEIANEVFFSAFDQPQKTKIFYGGSGSGKSISIAQYFCQKLYSRDGKRRAIFRKSFPFMKLTTYLVIKSILDDWGYPYHENKTDHYFEVGENRLYYLSLDQSEKIKGGEFKEVWLEEATEFDEEDYKQLRLRLSRDKYSEDVSIILSYNPVDENHWCVKLRDRAINEPDKYLVHHSTYKDNVENLSQSFMNELEDLINSDENFYRIYCLGEAGVLKNKIYEKYYVENIEDWPMGLQNAPHCYGLDFGFNNEMALVELWFFEGEFYFKELYYEKGKTTDELYIWMNDKGISHHDQIFADSAEPDRIEALCKSKKINDVQYYGFNVFPAKKDVKAGIDFLKSKKKHVSADSINWIKEARNYKYKETKDGQVLDEPIKYLDHLMDASRYAAYSMNISSGVAAKSPLPEKREPGRWGRMAVPKF